MVPPAAPGRPLLSHLTVGHPAFRIFLTDPRTGAFTTIFPKRCPCLNSRPYLSREASASSNSSDSASKSWAIFLSKPSGLSRTALAGPAGCGLAWRPPQPTSEPVFTLLFLCHNPFLLPLLCRQLRQPTPCASFQTGWTPTLPLRVLLR